LRTRRSRFGGTERLFGDKAVGWRAPALGFGVLTLIIGGIAAARGTSLARRRAVCARS
jgi:hypothetical protein